MATHSSNSCLENPMDGRAWWAVVHGATREESDMTERLHFHSSLSCTGEGKGNPLQCSWLENPRDDGDWWAAVYGVTHSRTRLKQLSNLADLTPQKGRISSLWKGVLSTKAGHGGMRWPRRSTLSTCLQDEPMLTFTSAHGEWPAGRTSRPCVLQGWVGKDSSEESCLHAPYLSATNTVQAFEDKRV